MANNVHEETASPGAVFSSFHVGRKCTHDLRACAECSELFEGCSMQKKQVTCSKLCWNRHFRQGVNDKRPRKRAPAPTAPGMKWCSGCSELRFLDLFHKHSKRGVQHKCAKCQRFDYINRNYKITPEQFERYQITESCEICGERVSGRNTQLDIDHDHTTLLVRGFLCNHCNRVLGHAHDDPALLRAAAEYLERHAQLSPS